MAATPHSSKPMKRFFALLLALLTLLALPACVEDDGEGSTSYDTTIPGEIVVPVPPGFEDF